MKIIKKSYIIIINDEEKNMEEVCGLDKKCQKRWLEAQSDCI
jgi:hypothetical protein|tara:strand:+ start:6263 stop:6388 length:126 start_codon:yes stop_codon:yes gene_type:complete